MLRRHHRRLRPVAMEYRAIETLESRTLLAGAPVAMTSGVTYQGTIDTPTDEDTFTFTASAGDTVQINYLEVSGTTAFSPRVRITGPTGAEIRNLAADSGAFTISGLPATGTYTVSVRDADSSSGGNYRLTMFNSRATHSLEAGEGPISSGVTISGTIGGGDIDVYTFSGTAGEAFQLNYLETSGTTAFLPHVQFCDPNGNELRGSLGDSDAIGISGLPTTGTYTITVRDADSNASGNYRFTMFKTGGPQSLEPGEGELASGQTKAGSIDFGDIDIYTFSANAGETVQLNFVETSGTTAFSPRVQIYGPNGYEIRNLSGDSGAFTIDGMPATGTYTVTVRDADGNTSGNYRFTMVKTLGPQTLEAGEGTLESGQTVAGTIDPGDIDVYTFSGDVGDTVLLNSMETSGTTAFSPRVQVYAPNGAEIRDLIGDSAGLTISGLPATGTYTITVRDADSNASGNYRFTMFKTTGPRTLEPDEEELTSGVTKAGTIDFGDIDVHTFSAVAGARLELSYAETSGTTAFLPQVQLFNPSGVEIRNFYGDSGSLIIDGLPNTGTYLVVIRDADGNASGNYDLTATVTGGLAPPAVTLAVDSPTVLEDGSGLLRYTFTRTGSTAAPLTVNFRVTGVAVAGEDYFTAGANAFNGRFGNIIFAAGSSTAVFIVSPADDSIQEDHENVRVDIIAGTGYTIGFPAGVGAQILNDDFPSTTAVTVSVDSPTVPEDGPGMLRYTFTRTGSTASALTVNFRVTGVAVAGDDYFTAGANAFNGRFGNIIFASGASTAVFFVSPRDDSVNEPHENVRVDILTGGGYSIGSPSGIGAQILNDDPASSVPIMTSAPIMAPAPTMTAAPPLAFAPRVTAVTAVTQVGTQAVAVPLNLSSVSGGGSTDSQSILPVVSDETPALALRVDKGRQQTDQVFASRWLAESLTGLDSVGGDLKKSLLAVAGR